jgi:hypothetical protein
MVVVAPLTGAGLGISLVFHLDLLMEVDEWLVNRWSSSEATHNGDDSEYE